MKLKNPSKKFCVKTNRFERFKHTSKASLFTILFLFFFSGPIVATWATPSSESLGAILTDERGQILYAKNIDKPFTPASILKILTSLTAFEVLGEQFRFPTTFYFDGNTKNLHIQGFGDPLFISEVIDQFCRQVKLAYPVKTINNLVIDDSYFSKKIAIPGKGSSLNPYDATLGAICANFNTVSFKQSSTGNLISAEPQTPLLEIFEHDIKKTGLRNGRIVLTKEKSRHYAGFLMEYFLKQRQVDIVGQIRPGPFPALKNTPIQTFYSPFDLSEVIQKLLKYSNNFMANQLVLAMGAKTTHPPATLEKGLSCIQNFVVQKLKMRALILTEGSGLSRKNQISPEQMLKVMIAFKPYYTLLNKKGNDYYKTGTLAHVRTRAGYFSGKNNQLYPYVIMTENNASGYQKIYEVLQRLVDSQP